jgi:hypothetical protein
MSWVRAVKAIRWYAALIAALVLGGVTVSGCGEDNDGAASKPGSIETRLVSTRCKKPAAAAKVVKSKRAGIVWAINGRDGHIWACSRAYGKVFLIGSVDQAPGKIDPQGQFPPFFEVARLSTGSVGYYLEQNTRREIPERTSYVYYSGALKTGKVHKVREGLLGPS